MRKDDTSNASLLIQNDWLSDDPMGGEGIVQETCNKIYLPDENGELSHR